jgi:hypothetical protein
MKTILRVYAAVTSGSGEVHEVVPGSGEDVGLMSHTLLCAMCELDEGSDLDERCAY